MAGKVLALAVFLFLSTTLDPAFMGTVEVSNKSTGATEHSTGLEESTGAVDANSEVSVYDTDSRLRHYAAAAGGRTSGIVEDDGIDDGDSGRNKTTSYNYTSGSEENGRRSGSRKKRNDRFAYSFGNNVTVHDEVQCGANGCQIYKNNMTFRNGKIYFYTKPCDANGCQDFQSFVARKKHDSGCGCGCGGSSTSGIMTSSNTYFNIYSIKVKVFGKSKSCWGYCNVNAACYDYEYPIPGPGTALVCEKVLQFVADGYRKIKEAREKVEEEWQKVEEARKRAEECRRNAGRGQAWQQNIKLRKLMEESQQLHEQYRQWIKESKRKNKEHLQKVNEFWQEIYKNICK